MALKGQRFNIDLSSNQFLEGDDDSQSRGGGSMPVLPLNDISERPVGGTAPSAPNIKPTPGGFPTHKKRVARSKFKSEQSNREQTDSRTGNNSVQDFASRPAALPTEPKHAVSQRQSINEENEQKLASMSTAEIDREREELFKGLNPSLIERLLKRSTIDEPEPDTDESQRQSAAEQGAAVDEDGFHSSSNEAQNTQSTKHVHFAQSNDDEVQEDVTDVAPQPSLEDAAVRGAAFHFPKPHQPPPLDPSSPSFFQDLHQKYFASLPADPSKLAWMQDVEPDSSYSPNSELVQIPNLRFNFKGSLIPPKQAENVSVTEGLHHHGDAPSSAGYTIPELARLARSSMATQRCIAYQTLGRIMYRLGIGEFGAHDEKIPKGLWKCINDGQVTSTLQEEANKKNGHVSANAYAVEALWLWRKGGGQKLEAV